MSSKKLQKSSFEDSLKRLEKIVESLESGEISLDGAVDLYEEGIRLSKECSERLKATELRIKKLTKDINGQLELTELDEE
ncbi:MAG TPA: exodeoxyribonuclease VII small subunit [Bacteroidetes bacterium]|nr:exodeoxyribonuclease VII small subunit [Bacteroidota bacterium]